MQHSKNSNWIVGFNEQFDAADLFGVKIYFDEVETIISDPNYMKPKEIIFRVMWLSPCVSRDIVKSYFMKNGIPSEHILDLVNEKCYEEKLKHIDNGVIRVICRQEDKLNDKYDRLVGKHVISDEKSFIARLGDPPRCFYCNKTDHVKRDCTKFKEDRDKICSN